MQTSRSTGLSADTERLRHCASLRKLPRREGEHRIEPFPSSQRRGGCAIKRMPRSDRSGADGVVRPAQRFAELTTPALRATPPLRGGEYPPLIRHCNYEKWYLGGEFAAFRATQPRPRGCPVRFPRSQ